MRTAIGFVTHLFSASVRERYLKLKSELSEIDTFIVAEQGTPIPEEFHGETVFFSFEELRESVPRILGTTLIPGNCHLTMLAFSRGRPGYEFYWQIEYDVVFRGSWKTFFDAWKGDESDLLAAHLRSEGEEPEWTWWDSMVIPTSVSKCRAFLPIYRISSRGLIVLNERVQHGWSGHFEALIPSALKHASLTTNDLGEGRFYTSFDSPDGVLSAGTHRTWPPHFFPLMGRDLIYHPVKPSSARPASRPTLLQLLGMLRLREFWRTLLVELRSWLP